MKFQTPHDEYVDEMEEELGEKAHRDTDKLLPAFATRKSILDLMAAAFKGLKEGLRARNYLIIRLFYATGVRVAEMKAFRVSDVFDDNRMFVREGKGREDRYVLVDDKTLAMVQKHIQGRPQETPIFDITVRQLRNIVTACATRVGLVKQYHAIGRAFGPHAIRHAFATHAMEGGMSMPALKFLMGHEHTETTQMYVHLSLRAIKHEYMNTAPLAQPDPEDATGEPGLARPLPFPGVSASAGALKTWMVQVINGASTDVLQALATLLSRVAVIEPPSPTASESVASRDMSEVPSLERIRAEYQKAHELARAAAPPVVGG